MWIAECGEVGVKEKIEKWIRETLETNGVVLVHPKELENGDYTLIINDSKAEEYFEKLKVKLIPEVKSLNFVAPRFINIYLSEQFFAESVQGVNEKSEKFGETKLFNGQKIMVEYTDPNPFKEFHIGHLMSNSIGEAVARIIEANGAQIKRANWQGDVGMHIANAIWGKMQKPELSWGEAYTYGAQKYEDNKDEITGINKKIYERSDTEVNNLYDLGRKESLEKFEELYKKLGTKFDHYFFESKEGVEGKQIVEAHLEDGIFEKSDGAIIFPGEKYGLHTRVFINSNGLPTYEAKEMGLNKKKFEVEPDLNKSIIITGNEIKEYFKVLLKAISLIFPIIAEKTVHLPHGMLRLPSGKMSSRTGDVITAESLIEQVKEKVREKIKDREFSAEEKENIAEMVAIGAIKYSILRQAIGGDIVFDFDKSISFEGDSGPYLQYSYVRAKSVLEKADPEKNVFSKKSSGLLASLGQTFFSKSFFQDKITRPEGLNIQEVEKILYRFPEVVERAGREYAPHHLVTYLTELASAFNSFYGNEKIIDPSTLLGAGEISPASAYKIALTEATAHVLKNGLHLLGIKAPERM
jgi:arginyl-tRNA synthetase